MTIEVRLTKNKVALVDDADRCKIKTLRAECDALKQRVNELEAELEKWRDHLCGGVPEYRDFGTTGMVMDQRGNLWKKT